jgi:hypothetical protein
MELVDGEDLSARLARGPMPLDEALPLARQIAKALGVGDSAAGFEPGLSPTFTSPAHLRPAGAASGTQLGTILGTAAYMAPEQAKGKPIDRRADIWAFGVVLYEMLVGRPLFAAETVVETLGLVVTREPDLTTLPPATPARVRELLRRCLECDPKQRLRDAGEARIVLSAPDDPPRAPGAGPIAARGARTPVLLVAAAVACSAWRPARGSRSACAPIRSGRRSRSTSRCPAPGSKPARWRAITDRRDARRGDARVAGIPPRRPAIRLPVGCDRRRGASDPSGFGGGRRLDHPALGHPVESGDRSARRAAGRAAEPAHGTPVRLRARHARPRRPAHCRRRGPGGRSARHARGGGRPRDPGVPVCRAGRRPGTHAPGRQRRGHHLIGRTVP